MQNIGGKQGKFLYARHHLLDKFDRGKRKGSVKGHPLEGCPRIASSTQSHTVY